MTCAKELVGAVLVTLLLVACSTTRVKPVAPQVIGSAASVDRICIVENPRVAVKEFVNTYQSALEQRGYKVEVIRDRKAYSLAMCPYLSEYTAFYAWDMVFYLSYAELTIYKDGKVAGSAVYRARSSRLVSDEEAVTRLVKELLPQ